MSGVELHSLRDVWYHNLEKFPLKLAAIYNGQGHKYEECDLLSDRLRRSLCVRFGLKKGDKVAIAAPNCFEYLITFWATMKSCAVAVPINVRLGPFEIKHILANSDAQILVVHKANWPKLNEALSACPDIRHVVGIGFTHDGVTPYGDLVAEGERYNRHPDIREEDLAIIMHTSGTTGQPKGAMMRHGDLLFNNKLAVYAHGLRHEDVHLLVVPMFHPTALYSLLSTSALLGSTVVLAPRAEARALVQLIEEYPITTFFGVPALLRFIAALPEIEESDARNRLRLIAYSGSRMPVETIRRLRQLFPNVMLHNFFGLTETISMTHVLPDRDADVRPESIGKILPHVSQRILDETGRETPRGQVGELHFHRSNVIPGYWKEPARLEESMWGDWFNTGDRAMVDKDGYVYLKGRSKDMIIVGGENVYSLEVEHCLLSLDKVDDAAVVGVPATGSRAHLGELVKAVIVVHPGSDLVVAEVKRHCMERMASFKVPQLIEFRPELPRNAAGKIVRRLLK